MTLFLIILVVAVLMEQFKESEPDCNCPLNCARHKTRPAKD